MNGVGPAKLLAAYAGGLALGAVLRGGCPGGVGQGLAVAGVLWLTAGWTAVREVWLRFRATSREALLADGSWYGWSFGFRPRTSFWRRPAIPPEPGRLILLLLLGLAGVWRMWTALGPAPPPLADLVRLFPQGPRRSQVVVAGTLVAAPEPRGEDRWVALVRPEGRPGRCGLIRLTVLGGMPAGLRKGDGLTALVKLYRPEPANPGEEPFAGVSPFGRLAALGWVSRSELQVRKPSGQGAEARRALGSPADHLAHAGEACVALLRRGFTDFLERGNRAAGRGILKALLLGDRSGLSEEVGEDFARAGAMHLLVVSGLHLSVVAAFLGETGRRLGLRWEAQLALPVVGVVFYASLAGWSPPVARAALMALSAQGAAWCGRRHDTRRALWLAAGVMLLHRPLLFFEAAFRLSVAAAWGVSALAPFMAERWGRTDALGRGWCTALGAQLATLPLVLDYFGRAPLLALTAGPLLVEAGTFLVEAAFVLGALGTALPFLAPPLASGLGVGAEVLYWAAKATASLPWATVNLPSLPAWLSLGYYAALGAGWQAWRAGASGAGGYPPFRWPGKGWLLLGGAAALAGTVGVAGVSPWLQCTFLSVGEGDALHLRLPGGVFAPHLLVDAGPSPGRVRDYLRRSAVQSVTGVIVTHLHRDHVAGLAGVRQVGPVGRVIAPGSGGYLAAAATGVEVAVVGAPEGGDRNEASRRVVVRYGRFALVTTGDAPLMASDPALAFLPPRASPAGRRMFLVVKVPHHGARGVLDEEFLDAWRPDLAVISVGPNAYGHPDPGLLALLRRKRIPVWRTDQAGAVRVTTDGRRIRLQAFRRRPPAKATAGTA